MEKFTILRGIAVPLLRDNIDTDAIIPASYMLAGIHPDFGRGLFGHWRYVAGFEQRPEFALNQPQFREAAILITGSNFGCGSSREAAVWALRQYGIRCVIAPSYGEIFFGNCCKNGVLPIVLPAETVAALANDAARAAPFTIDLRAQRLTSPSGAQLDFPIDPAQREILLEGLDEIALALRHVAAIDAFQRRDRAARPWIYDSGLAP